MKTDLRKTLRDFIGYDFNASFGRKVRYWLADNRDRADVDQALQQVWEELEVEADASTERSLRRVMQRAEQSRSGRTLLPLLRIAAVIAVVCALGFSGYLYNRGRHMLDTQTLECFVPVGQTRTVTLCDGTRVVLNAGTLLVYPDRFNAGTRSVYLSGEAFFDVAKNPDSPFVVTTSYLDITALGTSFNVKAYPESGRVLSTLNTGSISVTDRQNATSQLLVPAEQIEFDATTGDFVRSQVDPNDCNDWTRGNLTFRREPLSEIIATLERRFGINIRINADVDNTERYTVKFTRNDTLEEILNILTKTSGTYCYSQNGHTINIYANK